MKQNSKYVKEKIFIDTSAFKAIFDSNDEFHKKAWVFWQKAKNKNLTFIVTNYILDEFYTLVRVRVGKRKALSFRDALAKSEKSFQIVWITPDDEKEAWKFFKKLPGRGVSFTDCTSFAVMKRFLLKKVFTFDLDFKKAGFKVIPF